MHKIARAQALENKVLRDGWGDEDEVVFFPEIGTANAENPVLASSWNGPSSFGSVLLSLTWLLFEFENVWIAYAVSPSSDRLSDRWENLSRFKV